MGNENRVDFGVSDFVVSGGAFVTVIVFQQQAVESTWRENLSEGMASREADLDGEREDKNVLRESGSDSDDGEAALRKRLALVEAQLEELQLENAGQKAQIDRLQKDRIRKSILPQAKPLVCIKEEEHLKDSVDSVDKLEQFFKIFNAKSISSAQLSIHAINSLISLHQVLYNKEESSGSATPFTMDAAKSLSEKAAKVAFNYALEFMRQLNASKISKKEYSVDLGYPINWLLSLFPYNVSEEKKSELTDVAWMPLHFALALDSAAIAAEENSTYIDDIWLLLDEFGATAFEEDVSPLSVAVSVAQPNLEAVKIIVDFRPDCVRKVDEDGSLPLMHACANNTSLETIQFLYELYPEAASATDSFGCAAIHYAAFYGCAETVKYLISVEPNCANMVEGNGALPIHDAVQNQRDFGSTEMVAFLLQVNPDAVRKRDDYGAFPLHKAAKSSSLAIVKLLHTAFPKAMFGPDIEGLLPMHYYAERHDKDQHLDLMQFVLQANPQSKALDDTSLFAAEVESSASGWRGAIRSMWGSKPATSATTNTSASGTVSSSNGSRSASAVGSGAASKAPVIHNKRKSVRPVRGSIHEQYKR